MVICDTLASSQCNTRSQQGVERGTGAVRNHNTNPTAHADCGDKALLCGNPGRGRL
jgi:hypothetical protein